MMRCCSLLVLALAVASSYAFSLTSPSSLILRQTTLSSRTSSSPSTIALFAKDPSRSGNKRGRLNRLAELEDERVETDKGFVLKVAGGFVAMVVIAIASAAASGILY